MAAQELLLCMDLCQGVPDRLHSGFTPLPRLAEQDGVKCLLQGAPGVSRVPATEELGGQLHCSGSTGLLSDSLSTPADSE